MFSRYEAGERVILLNIVLSDQETDFAEFNELALSAGAKVVYQLQSKQRSLHARYLLGKGKVEELSAAVETYNAELVLVNASLTPSQERNLEKTVDCRVCDRTGLILDIFAKRAITHEGKLQVELAQLSYMATRLVRGWTHLERQRGGRIGLTGPGETQLELDKRLLRQRIKKIQQRLLKVRQQRKISRSSRQKASIPAISLVGYTNVGKSTIFNLLTKANVLSKDQLFATLDPTIRKIEPAGIGLVMLTDTVGFIKQLPHNLIDAFRATLEEVQQADLLLHVIDASDVNSEEHKQQVLDILHELKSNHIPLIEVYNKIDLCEQIPAKINIDKNNTVSRVMVSAKTGEGMDSLLEVLANSLKKQRIQDTIVLSPNYGKLRSVLYAHKAVVNEVILESGEYQLEIDIDKTKLLKLCHESEVTFDDLQLTKH